VKPDKIIDAKLVEAYQSGNKEALAELIKRWHVIFCNKAFWIVKDPDLSKDIAQDCWQIIMNKIHTLKDSSSFNSWALRIVYSKSFDTLRNNTRHRNNQQKYANEQPLFVAVEEQNDALKRALLNAIQDLSDQQQQVITLFYVQSYSLKEIGELLKISVGTAKSRLFHAREKLKQVLKK